MKTRIAIFASGNGTNAETIMRHFSAVGAARQAGKAEVVLVVTNRREAGVVERAERLNIECVYLPRDAWSGGSEVLSLLRSREIDFIVLAGFLLLLPRAVVEAYPRRIVNIHPALLPKFGGRGMYGMNVHEAVIEAGETESGITIHFVDEAYDHGEVIAQYRCPVLPGDTPGMLAARIQTLEYAWYPEVIEKIVNG